MCRSESHENAPEFLPVSTQHLPTLCDAILLLLLLQKASAGRFRRHSKRTHRRPLRDFLPAPEAKGLCCSSSLGNACPTSCPQGRSTSSRQRPELRNAK